MSRVDGDVSMPSPNVTERTNSPAFRVLRARSFTWGGEVWALSGTARHASVQLRWADFPRGEEVAELWAAGLRVTRETCSQLISEPQDETGHSQY